MPKMNKREERFVDPRIARLEKAVEADGYRKQLTMSVDTGRDIQSAPTTGQRRSLNKTVAFLTQQGFRRRHPLLVLHNYANVVRPNNDAHTKYEQALEDENKRVQLPAIVKKTRNEMIANQMNLVRTAAENFAKSKTKLDAMTAVGS